MTQFLSPEYWNERYLTNDFAWDAGTITIPLQTYFDQLFNKEVKILIPGAGNAHEAEYLVKNGFTNVYVCDIALEPLKNLKKRCPTFKSENLLLVDFFQLNNIKSNIADVSSSIGDVKSSIGNVKSSVGDVKSSVVDVKSSIGDVKSSIGDVRSSVVDVRSSVVETYDLIIEQTFFCALDPKLRSTYFKKIEQLLNPGGKLVGVLFDDKLNTDKPPFGGNKEEYLTYITGTLKVKTFERCYNSIKPRKDRELFINLVKQNQ
ncbi:SAM-dependent methyltransferase [Sphingobacteriaceae bacterium]|nr:SAM-dependent methyltransferase [Sphingobacteriaceae bacterium]